MTVAILLFVHLLAVVVWVGGMFFAHMALRPALALLAPPQRLTLMAATLGRFFAWVALAVAMILGTGAGLIALTSGWAHAGAHVHAMTVGGGVMSLVFSYLASVPYAQLRAGVARQDWASAAAALARIRQGVAFNLVLGLLIVAAAVLGRGTT